MSYTGRAGDRGATLITFALSIVAICAVIALVLGGSIGYDAERNSQTSSDSAALAATSALRNVQTLTPPPSLVDFDVVYDTAETMARANGADEADAIGCELIAADRTPIADCGSATLAQFIDASGVRVGTGETRDVPLGEVNGLTSIKGDTGAAATIQPLISGDSPFMVCSSAGATEGHPVKIIDTDPPYTINPSAIGESFVLWGNDMKNGDRQCGGSSASWRGWVDNSSDQVHQLPGWWNVDTGDKSGHLVPRLLINPQACDVGAEAAIESVDGCVVAVPLCPYSNDALGENTSGNNLRLYCVRFGAFELSYHFNEDPAAVPCQRGADDANKVMCGKFLGAAVAVGGQGSDDQATVDDVVVIKLVE